MKKGTDCGITENECLFLFPFKRVFGDSEIFSVIFHCGYDAVDFQAVGNRRGRIVVPVFDGRDADGNNPETSVDDIAGFIDPETRLENEGIHILWLVISGETEIAEGITDINSVILLNGIDAVGMMSDDEIGAAVHRKTPHFFLVGCRSVIQFVAPVERNNYNGILLFCGGDVSGYFFIQEGRLLP